ncbi:hypothetical protein [Streptomyces sp. NPDC020681]
MQLAGVVQPANRTGQGDAEGEPARIELGTRLVVRNSTAAVRPAAQ